MKISDLLNSKSSLEKLFDQDLPVRTSYKLGKFIKSINKELEDFNEFRSKLLDKYGKKQEDGNYTVDGDNLKLFETDLQEILETTLDVEIPTFTLEELKDSKLSGRDLLILEYLITE